MVRLQKNTAMRVCRKLMEHKRLTHTFPDWEHGIFLLGNWHSHPESPARPSEEDKRLAYDKTASYMILSLMNKNAPILKSYIINGENAQQETLKYV